MTDATPAPVPAAVPADGFVTREQLLAQTKRRYRTEPIPGFGKVRLQSLTEGEKSDYEAETLSKKGDIVHGRLVNARRRLVVRCVVDARGNRLFADGDESLLTGIDGMVTSRIYDIAREHCGFQAGDIEELVGNSE